MLDREVCDNPDRYVQEFVLIELILGSYRWNFGICAISSLWEKSSISGEQQTASMSRSLPCHGRYRISRGDGSRLWVRQFDALDSNYAVTGGYKPWKCCARAAKVRFDSDVTERSAAKYECILNLYVWDVPSRIADERGRELAVTVWPTPDLELLAVSAVLYDLRLTNRYSAQERFEVDWDNAARSFLKENAFRVLSGLIGHASDQLVQSRHQQLEDGRPVRLFVAEDQIDSWRISLERAARHRRK